MAIQLLCQQEGNQSNFFQPHSWQDMVLRERKSDLAQFFFHSGVTRNRYSKTYLANNVIGCK